MIVDIDIKTGSVTPLEITETLIGALSWQEIDKGTHPDDVRERVIDYLVNERMKDIAYTWTERSQ